MDYYNAPVEFFNNLHRISVTVVGAGGTGSLVMSRLARIHMVLVDMGYKGLNVLLIDNDTVEAGNIGRQMFTEGDIGSFKSDALISKINMAFGLNWDSLPEKYVSGTRIKSNVVVSCVDNIPCRKAIAKHFYDYKVTGQNQHQKHFLWFDCGNGKNFGQVIMTDRMHKLPSVFDIYGDLSKHKRRKSVQGEGCSIWNKLQDQSLFINDDIAVAFGEMFWTLLRDKRIDYHAAYMNLDSFNRNKALIKNIS